jgi:acetolactate synthase-1/3 small subunit
VLVPAEPVWTVVLDAMPAAAGAVDAERVYIALQSERVTALGRSDGRVAWTRDIESTTAPVVSAGVVYVLASMRHIIAITLQNESGALTRVAGLFSTRGYNIESLNVAPTDDPAVSRLTLVTTGNDAVIHQISQQLLKLVDVVDVEDVTREEHFERELLLVKVKAKATQVGSLWSATQRAGGRVLWDVADSFTIELTSSEADINRFVAEVANFGDVLEVVRSGALAIQKGRQVLEG